MKNLVRCVLAAGLCPPLVAATNIWDGGGINPAISTAGNWLGDIAPVSDVLATRLVFTGSDQTSVLVDAPLAVDSLIFDVGAKAFTLSGFGLTVGAGGILNESENGQTIASNIVLGAATSDFFARNESLAFANVNLGTSELTLRGNFSQSFASFAGTGSVSHTGAGEVRFGMDGAAAFDLTITGGGVVTVLSSALPAVFGGASAIAITTGAFHSEADLVLDGATLVRSQDAALMFAPGKSFTVQGAGTATFEGGALLTAQSNTITGANSMLLVNGGVLSLAAGSSLSLAAGGSAQLAGGLEIGAAPGGAMVNVDAAQFAVAGTSLLGALGGAGNMIFSNSASGSFANVNIGTGPDVGSSGVISVLGGSTVASGSLAVGTAAVPGTSGNLTLDGAGSIWTQAGASTLAVGSPSGGSGGVVISNGAVFHSGSGLITIAPTGVLAIATGGIFNAKGDVLVNGGEVLNQPAGVISLNLTPGKNITVQNGGKLGIGLALNLEGGSDVFVSGAGSVLTGGFLSPQSNGSTVTVQNGGTITLVGALQNARGVVTVDGAGSHFASTGSTTLIGIVGGTASVIFSNGATGAIGVGAGGSTDIPGFSGSGSTGVLSVQSGAVVEGNSLRIGFSPNNPNGELIVTGAGSMFTQTGNRVNQIGTGGSGLGRITVSNGGMFSSSATSSFASTTVGPHGIISILGGTFLANDNLTLDGGQLSRSNTGVFAIAPARLFKIQNGGDALISGNFSHNTASNIAVTGAGSTLTFAGGFTAVLNGGVFVFVDEGAALSSGGFLELGTGGNGSLSVTGMGTTASGSTLRVGGNGGTGTFLLDSGATATFGTTLLSATGADGQTALTVQGGAALTLGNVTFASTSGGGFFTVSGAGSSVILSGASTLNFGATANGTAAVNVNAGAVFSTGSGTVTIGANGVLNIGGGTFNANGSVTVNGQVSRTGGAFVLQNGRSLTVQNGGDVMLGEQPLTFGIGSVLTVTGSGSIYTAGGDLAVFGSGAGINVLAGGAIALVGGALFKAALGPTIVDGAGSQFSVAAAEPSIIGINGNSVGVTFSNGASGSFPGGLLVPSIFNGFTNGTLTIASGADVTSGSLDIASVGFASPGATGTVNVIGAGSTLELSGAASLKVGTLGGPAGLLGVGSGGAFTSGTGGVIVGPGGTVSINGGTFTALSALTLDGGQLARDAGGSLLFPTGANVAIQAGGDAVMAGSFTHTTGVTTVTGLGSTLTTTGGSQFVSGGAVVNVTSGGALIAGGVLLVGTAGNGTAVFSGSATTASITGAGTSVIGGAANGSVTFSGGANGVFAGGLSIASIPGGGSGTLAVQTGADVTTGGALMLGGEGAGAATLSVSGSGSTFTQSGADGVTLGGDFGSAATLSVSSGGAFTSGTGPVALSATATINISGGTVTIGGPLLDNGGVVNFATGAFSYVGDLAVGPGGLLGDDLTLQSGRLLTLTGTTSIAPFQTLVLAGGLLSTGALINSGTLDFQKGTLAITGIGGMEIGAGALGANVVLAPGAVLNVTHTLTVASGGVFALVGGSLSAGSLANMGLVEHQSGIFAINGGVLNHANFLASRPLTIGGVLDNKQGAKITLLAPAGQFGGAGSFSNSGLLSGEGFIELPFANTATGEVRAESGRTLRFTGVNVPNAGSLTMQGGTIEFIQPFTNASGGALSGRGTLSFGGGFINEGAVNLSGGFTDVFGSFAQTGAGTTIVSGGATGTFHGPVAQNGVEFRTSVGSRSVFFGSVSGAGSFTGAGETYFEGGYSPGASPAVVALSTSVTFTAGNILTMEIGGVTPGPGVHLDDGYDRLVFTSPGMPMVTWGGTLLLDFINNFTPQPGQTFDLFDFDPARAVGSFAQITLAPGDALPPGVALDFTDLYATGEIHVVVPEPSSILLLGLGVLLCTRLRKSGVARVISR